MMPALTVVQYILPLVAMVILFTGFRTRRVNFILAALWISLLAMMFQYKLMGGEILGTRFDYSNATIYSLNLIVVVAALLYLLISAPRFRTNKVIRVLTILFVAFLLTASTILLVNMWVNAQFLESRLDGTPVVQAGTFMKPEYCQYDYVYYIVDTHGKIRYLCPNHYGLLPSTGELDAAPAFLPKLLTSPPKAAQP